MLKIWISSWRYLCFLFPRWIAKSAESFFLSTFRVPRPSSELAFYETAKKYKLDSGLQAFEWGAASDPLVVLLHGWNGRGTQMGHFVAPLISLNYRVIALDGPAHGDSPGSKTDIKQFSGALLETQKQLGDYKAIISHSFGTGCCVLSTSMGLHVQKLVLIAGPSKYDRMIQLFVKRVGLNSRSKNYFYKSLKQRTGLDPQDINIGLIGSKLDVSALIVHDISDKAVDVKNAKDLHGLWPSTELKITEGLGHYRILKDQSVIDAAVEFIDRKVILKKKILSLDL